MSDVCIENMLNEMKKEKEGLSSSLDGTHRPARSLIVRRLGLFKNHSASVLACMPITSFLLFFFLPYTLLPRARDK